MKNRRVYDLRLVVDLEIEVVSLFHLGQETGDDPICEVDIVAGKTKLEKLALKIMKDESQGIAEEVQRWGGTKA